MVFSYALLVLLATIISLLSLTGLKNANKELNEFIDHPFTADAAVKMCRIEVNVAARTIREMLIDNTSDHFQNYKQKVQENMDMIQENFSLFASSYEKQDGLVDKYEAALLNWIDIGNSIINEIEQGNIEKS